jgi:hypothetical protein
MRFDFSQSLELSSAFKLSVKFDIDLAIKISNLSIKPSVMT